VAKKSTKTARTKTRRPRQRTIYIDVKPGQVPPYNMTGDMTFENKKRPGFFINFKIVDDGGGYVFPTDQKKAFAAKAGKSGCPQQGVTWSELEPRKVKDQNKTLRVRNYNKESSSFRFTLFVTKTPNAANPQFLALDPGGDNMNGQYS
jgi:transposase InsO family protein